MAWTGRGRVKDLHTNPTLAGRRIRIHRNGMAILSGMFSRAYLRDAHRAHRDGDLPTIDDPTRTRD
jgi:hypothetical protein